MGKCHFRSGFVTLRLTVSILAGGRDREQLSGDPRRARQPLDALDDGLVVVANDGAEAIRRATEETFDLILLDIGLPRISGYEVARRIRAILGASVPQLVALTGWGQEDDRQQSALAGFDDHWVKPLDPQALDRLLAALPRRGGAT